MGNVFWGQESKRGRGMLEHVHFGELKNDGGIIL
jgi:hypothetical protein